MVFLFYFGLEASLTYLLTLRLIPSTAEMSFLVSWRTVGIVDV